MQASKFIVFCLFPELPGELQMYTDPVTGKMFIGKHKGKEGDGGDMFEIWTDPETGKQFIRTKDGQCSFLSIAFRRTEKTKEKKPLNAKKKINVAEWQRVKKAIKRRKIILIIN